MLIAGLGGVTRHGSAALTDGGRLVAVCEQGRVTRVGSAGFNVSGLPDEALDTTLQQIGQTRAEVDRYVAAEPGPAHAAASLERVDRHLAHASAAYLSSPYSSATIVVCDQQTPKVSVWEGRGAEITRIEWPWEGPGLADLYSRCAAILGFRSEAGGQRMEALARLRPDHRDERLDSLLMYDGTRLRLHRGWEHTVEQWRDAEDRRPGSPSSAMLAVSLQARIIELVLELLADVRRRTTADRLCLAGSLFYHSSINTAVRRSGLYTDVFVPVDPGESGLSVGAALHAGGCPPRPASPFLGPSYPPYEVKGTLENCKLQYGWEPEEKSIAIAVQALVNGSLVGWFDGAMEWGPRALGARCILANPFSPYVLENLNRFLKRREAWRGYALSGSKDAVREHFDGPAEARFMECDYRPRDPARFRHVLPAPEATLRMHTVEPLAAPRFTRLLEAFGAATGIPVLVNTSFNGFHEPIVCSPRDAVRVFYGSGLDLLVLEQFVLRK